MANALQLNLSELRGRFYRADNVPGHPHWDYEPNGYLGISTNDVGVAVAVFSIKEPGILRDTFGYFAKSGKFIYDPSNPSLLLGGTFTQKDLESAHELLLKQGQIKIYPGLARAMADMEAVLTLSEKDKGYFLSWISDRYVGSPLRDGQVWLCLEKNFG